MDIKYIIEANGIPFTVAFLTLSLASVALVIWRWLLNFHAGKDLARFRAGLAEADQTSGNREPLERLLSNEKELAHQLSETLLVHAPQGKVAVRRAFEEKLDTQIIPGLNFLLTWILFCIRIAPMMGLLGTVVGMILAFDKIAGATKVEPSALAKDIGMALFTTAEGLLIAIPLMLAYAMFRERALKFEKELQQVTASALDLAPRIQPRP